MYTRISGARHCRLEIQCYECESRSTVFVLRGAWYIHTPPGIIHRTSYRTCGTYIWYAPVRTHEYRTAVIPLSSYYYSSIHTINTVRTASSMFASRIPRLIKRTNSVPGGRARFATLANGLTKSYVPSTDFSVRSPAHPRMRARRGGLHSFDDAIHDGQVHVSTNTNLPVAGLIRSDKVLWKISF